MSGGLDPFADLFHEQLESLKGNPRFTGIRLGGSAFRSERSETDRNKLRAALIALMEAELMLDLLVLPGDLADVASYLEELPMLMSVVNCYGGVSRELNHSRVHEEKSENGPLASSLFRNDLFLLSRRSKGYFWEASSLHCFTFPILQGFPLVFGRQSSSVGGIVQVYSPCVI